MTDNIENLLLEHLKALRNEVAILRVEMHDEFRDLKQRVSSLVPVLALPPGTGFQARSATIRARRSRAILVRRLSSHDWVGAMTDNTENLVIEHLKAVRNELRDFRNRFDDEMDDIKTRISGLETAMVSVKREVNYGDEVDARQQVSLDRILKRLDRLERRLELTS